MPFFVLRCNTVCCHLHSQANDLAGGGGGDGIAARWFAGSLAALLSANIVLATFSVVNGVNYESL